MLGNLRRPAADMNASRGQAIMNRGEIHCSKPLAQVDHPDKDKRYPAYRART